MSLLAGPAGAVGPDDPVVTPERVTEAVQAGVAALLTMQEGDEKAEWPYEGVYRVGRQIPVGYRVGGTSIVALALLAAPGYDDDADRRAAVARAAAFVIATRTHDLMRTDTFDGGYDVRAWGQIYALHFLLRLKADGRTPAECADSIDGAIRGYLAAVEEMEIPKAGGWNYARQPGKDAVSAPSPFMTGPALQALFEARRQGYEVNEGVIERGLVALERSRDAGSGAYSYSGSSGKGTADGLPGSIGRMVVGESTLVLAGRGSVARLKLAVDAFVEHWEWLEKRRAKPGTHEAPYGVAPYYFYFAHHYAAQAVELLPEADRPAYRDKLNGLLFATRSEAGTWNDRVFPRSANFGTAMSVLAMTMPGADAPAPWAPDAEEELSPAPSE